MSSLNVMDLRAQKLSHDILVQKFTQQSDLFFPAHKETSGSFFSPLCVSVDFHLLLRPPLYYC